MRPVEREECDDHSDLQHMIMSIADDLGMIAFQIMNPMVERGEMSMTEAASSHVAVMLTSGIEIGLKAALLDPVFAQKILDHLDERSPIQGEDLAGANMTTASDARRLLEAAARL